MEYAGSADGQYFSAMQLAGVAVGSVGRRCSTGPSRQARTTSTVSERLDLLQVPQARKRNHQLTGNLRLKVESSMRIMTWTRKTKKEKTILGPLICESHVFTCLTLTIDFDERVPRCSSRCQWLSILRKDADLNDVFTIADTDTPACGCWVAGWVDRSLG